MVGSAPVTSARDSVGFGLVVVPNPEVRVRDGDIRIARGELELGFTSILVSSAGLGFVALDSVDPKRGEPVNVFAVTIVSGDGLVRHRRKLSALFTEEENLLIDDSSGDGSEWSFALRNLPVVLGDRAARWLCIAAPRFGEDRRGVAREAMATIRSEAAIPELLHLLTERGDWTGTVFALECFKDRGSDAIGAVPEVIKLLEEGVESSDRNRVARLAAQVLANIGPPASGALPALNRLAARLVPEEWEKLLSARPRCRQNLFGEMVYSENEFIDAICKIKPE